MDLAGMVGVIKTPSGGSEPCLLKKMPDGQLGEYHFSHCLETCIPEPYLLQSVKQDIRDTSQL